MADENEQPVSAPDERPVPEPASEAPAKPRDRVRSYLNLGPDEPIPPKVLEARIEKLAARHAESGSFGGAELDEYRTLLGARLAHHAGAREFLTRVFKGSLDLVPTYTDVSGFVKKEDYQALLAGLIRELSSMMLAAYQEPG